MPKVFLGFPAREETLGQEGSQRKRGGGKKGEDKSDVTGPQLTIFVREYEKNKLGKRRPLTRKDVVGEVLGRETGQSWGHGTVMRLPMPEKCSPAAKKPF